MDTPAPRKAVLQLVGAHIVTQAKLEAIQALLVKAAEHLPESMLDDLSPTIWMERRQKEYLEMMLPYFDDEVGEVIKKELSHSEGLDDIVKRVQKDIRKERGDEE